MMVHPLCLVHCKLDNSLGTRGEADQAHNHAIAPTDSELYGGAYLVQIYTQVVEHASGHAVTFASQTEQYMLGAYVVVVEALCFFLGQLERPASTLGKLVEAVGHICL